MKQKFFYVVLLFPLLFLEANDRAVRISPIMKTEQRVALVIGNNSYQGALSSLQNPINDARAIRDILEAKGFKVIYREDGDKKGMRKALNQFSSTIKNGGVGFFYFAGHGLEIDGQNYLIPVDAEIDEKSDTQDEAISLGKITRRMQSAKNRLNIVVLDACRNDPFSRSVGTGGLAKSEPRGLFVSYSTGAGSVASDGKAGENGLFTKSLIKHMNQGLNLVNVFKETRKEVFYNSKEKQFPAIYDQTIDGDFFFTLPKASSKGIDTSGENINRSETIPNNNSFQNTPSNIENSNLTFEEKMDDDFDKFLEDMK